MEITVVQLDTFLKKVNNLFPVPLSEKQDLTAFASKLCDKATLCTVCENGHIVSLVAGYTENVTNNMAYISVAATLPQAQGRGYAGRLVTEFLAVARRKNLDAVHLYAVRSNTAAMSMYRSLGFEEWVTADEPRPEDVHLIYRFRKEDGA